MHDPSLVVVRVDLVGGGEARLDLGGLIRLGQVPQKERIVEIVADETIPFKTLVGVTRGYRDVAGGHADGQGAARTSRVRERCEQRQSQCSSAKGARRERRSRPSTPALMGTQVGATDSHRSSLRGGFK
jgi:hypothetical protein